jgi:hypothetical protein
MRAGGGPAGHGRCGAVVHGESVRRPAGVNCVRAAGVIDCVSETGVLCVSLCVCVVCVQVSPRARYVESAFGRRRLSFWPCVASCLGHWLVAVAPPPRRGATGGPAGTGRQAAAGCSALPSARYPSRSPCHLLRVASLS